jgi:hypothetical protein
MGNGYERFEFAGNCATVYFCVGGRDRDDGLQQDQHTATIANAPATDIIANVINR